MVDNGEWQVTDDERQWGETGNGKWQIMDNRQWGMAVGNDRHHCIADSGESDRQLEMMNYGEWQTMMNDR